ncbi:MAG: hypothetical protein PUB96_02780 [Helicobacteraceae bacterium]|nr:hypothetical protein [Helicobacteraceae bacterium]
MISDAIKWDKKHKESKQSTKPLQLLENFINLAPSGIALDLACGMGRNARFM